MGAEVSAITTRVSRGFYCKSAPNRTGYSVDMTGGGCSSATNRRISAKKFLSGASFTYEFQGDVLLLGAKDYEWN
jgi:hypothetical protein